MGIASESTMKIVIQRVSKAAVEIDNRTHAAINRGLVLLCGFGHEDSDEILQAMANKVANLRIFPDQNGRFHYSVLEIQGEVLVIPQFTLYADTSKGRRPEFFAAMKPDCAASFFDGFVAALKNTGLNAVEQGVFAADMQVSLVNDGPVTILV